MHSKSVLSKLTIFLINCDLITFENAVSTVTSIVGICKCKLRFQLLSAGADPGILERGFKFTNGVRFLNFTQILYKLAKKMK